MTYRHYKGGLYTLVGVAHVEATLEPVVVYKAEDGTLWTRPAAEFFGVVQQTGVGGLVTAPRFSPASLPGSVA